MSSSPGLVLASASPRRHRLLEEAGLSFEIDPADVDESHAGGEPGQVALELAERKARAVAARRGAEPRIVLGADTVVGLTRGEGYTLLGKPADGADAEGMLESLSGTRHVVATGVFLLRADTGESLGASERTWVSVRRITPSEVAAYVASGEWRGKAGGYAIQETADRFVTSLEGGGFDNVVGLPVALTLDLLARLRG